MTSPVTPTSGEPGPRRRPEVPDYLRDDPKQQADFSLTTALTWVTLAVAFFALYRAEPGWGMFTALLAVPPFLRTCLLARRRKSAGRPLTTAEKTTAFLGSFGVALTASMLLSIVAFGTLLATCIVNPPTWGHATARPHNQTAEAVILVIGVVLFVVASVSVVFWIGRRWRRDFQNRDGRSQGNDA